MSKNVSTTKSSIKGFTWIFFGGTFDNIAQLVIIGVLARLLTPEDFGIIGIILLFVNFSNIYSQMGVGTALVQRKELKDEHISLGFSLAFILGLLIGAIFYFLAPYVGSFFNLEGLEGPIRFFSFFFPLKGLNSISEALLQRNMRFPAIVKCKSIAYLFGYGFTAITLAFLGFGLWSLIYGQLAILLVQSVLLFFYIKPRFSLRNHLQIYKDLLFFGSGHTLDLNFNYFAENADNLVVGKMLDAASLGIYSRAFQLYSIPSSFLGNVYHKVLLPVLSSKQDDTKALSSFYVFSISFCLLVLLPASLLLLFNAELLVLITLGNQWTAVIVPFQILVLGSFLRFATRINKSYLTSLGLVYHGAWYQFIYAAMAIGFCIIGAHYMGLNGVALAVVLAAIINYIQVAYRIKKRLGFKFEYFLGLHVRAFLMYMPVIAVIALCNYLGFMNMSIVVLISIFIVIPLMALPFYLRSSIFYDKNNTLMFNQLVDHSPQWMQRIVKKLKIDKR